MSRLHKFYRQFDPSKRNGFFLLFGAVLLMRLVLLAAKIKMVRHELPEGYEGFWGVFVGDSMTYINAWKEGFRMPMYNILFDFFRMFGSDVSALNAILIVQVIISSVSTVFVARIVKELTGRISLALLAFVIYCFAFQVVLYDWYLLPQSLVTAFVIFYTWHSIRYIKTRGNQHLFFGLLFAYFIWFLYPTFVGVVVPLLFLALYFNRRRFIYIAGRILLFALPFLVLESIYMLRNKQHFGKYSLSAPTYNAFGARNDDDVKHELFQLGMAVGADICYWQPGSEMRWFQLYPVPLPNGKDGYDTTARFPIRLLKNTRITADSLQEIKSRITLVKNSLKAYPREVDTIEATLSRFTSYVKEEDPLRYHLLSRLRMLGQFFTYKGNDSIFFREGNSSGAIRFLKPVVQLLYYPVMLISLLFFPIMLFRRRFTAMNLFFLYLFGYTILMFPLLFKVIEHRYFSTGYFVMLTLTMMVVADLGGKRKNIEQGRRS